MRFVLMTEPQQGMSYADQLASARHAEASGFEAWFRSDHYASFPGAAGQPTTDAWTVLAGLARETERIGLGVLVSPVTFRHPGVLAKVVTTVDWMSGGRVEVGVGAGWNAADHTELGLAFPPIGERADLLEDQLAMLQGLWGEPDGWTYAGRSGLQVEGSLFRPRPVEVAGRPTTAVGGSRPRIIVGGQGSPRSFRLAAAFADEFNVSSKSPADVTAVFAKLDEACAAIGRDPATLARSAMVGTLVGATEAELARREQDILERFGIADDGAAWLDERRPRWILGLPDAARETVRAYAAVGVERLVLQVHIPWDLDHVDLLGDVLVSAPV